MVSISIFCDFSLKNATVRCRITRRDPHDKVQPTPATKQRRGTGGWVGVGFGVGVGVGVGVGDGVNGSRSNMEFVKI